MPTRRLFVLAATIAMLAASPAHAQDKSIVVASTTSTQDSGLFGHILPLFKAKTGIDVKVVAQGTGQALDTGRRGDADVLFVHAKPQEEKFIADGAGVKRYPVMYNDFILVGPKSDPAGDQGHDRRHGGIESHQGQGRALHLARRPLGHACRRARALEGRRHRHRQGQGRLVQGDRPGHGRRAQYRVGGERLRARRPRHLALVQEPRRSRHPASQATSACSTSTASCW